MIGIKIHIKAVALYLFGLLLIYLAGMSMGGVLLFMFYVLFFFPLVSIIRMIVNVINFKFFENFSTEHPLKGEVVQYQLEITNESHFFIPGIKVQFKSINFDVDTMLSDLNITLGKGEKLKKKYEIRCPYRGIYTVGLKKIELRDILGWITVYPKVWYRTFYVYPRIITINARFIAEQNSRNATGINRGSVSDNTLFKGLNEYRDGMPVRYIAWKKLLSSGIPYIKEFDESSWPGLDIYLDLRRQVRPTSKVLEKEDCSIEILVAIVRYLLLHNIPVKIHAPGKIRYYFYGNTMKHFHDFHESTINLTFQNTISPLQLYRTDVSENAVISRSIIFITHTTDPEIFDFVINTSASNINAFIIFNLSGMNDEEIHKSQHYIDAVKDKGGKILAVRNPESIKTDLEEW